MILTCPKCATRLQLESAKLPARAFTIKCPKCQNVISVAPPETANDESITNAPTTPLTAMPAEPEEKPHLAESKLPKLPVDLAAPPAEPEYDAIKALASMLTSALAQSGKPNSGEQT